MITFVSLYFRFKTVCRLYVTSRRRLRGVELNIVAERSGVCLVQHLNCRADARRRPQVDYNAVDRR